MNEGFSKGFNLMLKDLNSNGMLIKSNNLMELFYFFRVSLFALSYDDFR
jgi:hypothetical protein